MIVRARSLALISDIRKASVATLHPIHQIAREVMEEGIAQMVAVQASEEVADPQMVVVEVTNFYHACLLHTFSSCSSRCFSLVSSIFSLREKSEQESALLFSITILPSSLT
jgi:hypothetical protein